MLVGTSDKVVEKTGVLGETSDKVVGFIVISGDHKGRPYGFVVVWGVHSISFGCIVGATLVVART